MKYLLLTAALFIVSCAKKDGYTICQPYFRYCLGNKPECIGYVDYYKGGIVEAQDCDEVRVGHPVIVDEE